MEQTSNNSRSGPETVRLLIKRIEAVDGTMQVARALVAAGRSVGLSGLESEIGGICAGTIDLDAAEGRRLRPMLILILHQVDELVTTLAETGCP